MLVVDSADFSGILIIKFYNPSTFLHLVLSESKHPVTVETEMGKPERRNQDQQYRSVELCEIRW